MSHSTREAALEYRAAVVKAALKYRAVVHNRPHGQTLEEHRSNDERVGMTEIRLEGALLKAGLMKPEDAIETITIGAGEIVVELEDRFIEVPL